MAPKPHIIDPHLHFPMGLARRRGSPPGCVVHNAGGPGPVSSWHNYHLSLGWRGIAYNQCAMLNGDLVKGRGDEMYGGHTHNYGSWMGFVFEGNYNSLKKMPQCQFDAGAELLRYWLDVYGEDWPIKPHRDMPANSTDCPGNHFPFAELLRAARGPEVDIVRLKRAMVAFAQAHDVKIPAEFALTTAWGPGAQTLAWRVSGRLEKAQTKVDGKLIVQTGKPRMVLAKALKA